MKRFLILAAAGLLAVLVIAGLVPVRRGDGALRASIREAIAADPGNWAVACETIKGDRPEDLSMQTVDRDDAVQLLVLIHEECRNAGY